MTASTDLFECRHRDVTLWDLRYALTYRDLQERMAEWGVSLIRTTVYRWVQGYGPELDDRCPAQTKI